MEIEELMGLMVLQAYLVTKETKVKQVEMANLVLKAH